jgi:hypothetical protein
MEELELYNDYSYTKLEELMNEMSNIDPNIEWHESDDFEIGKSILWINLPHKLYTFIMIGLNSKGAIYRLIYES